jgi:glycosyltransferase involved in cell wall biosynthesis
MIGFLGNRGVRQRDALAPGPRAEPAAAPRRTSLARIGSPLPAASTNGAIRVSCVMPAYNEREIIDCAVRRVRESLERLTAEFEIIVVDDGSTDGTGRVLDEMADRRLRVIHFAENTGYGRALRAGFAAAVHPFVFFTDSDDQFDPDDVGRLLPWVGDADLVVGYRCPRGDGALRSLLSGGYNALVRGMLGLAVRDVNCAFKLIRRDALHRLALSSDGYAINAEMLALAIRAGLRIREVPVHHRLRRAGQSKVGLGDIPRTLSQVVELRRTIRGAVTNGNGSGA